jgi:hypothetical protein
MMRRQTPCARAAFWRVFVMGNRSVMESDADCIGVAGTHDIFCFFAVQIAMNKAGRNDPQ